MSFIHIPKSQFTQLFRTSRTDPGSLTVGGVAETNYMSTSTSPQVYQGNIDTSFLWQLNNGNFSNSIRLFKGTPPTIAQFDAFPYLMSSGTYSDRSDYFTSCYASRASDFLVHLPIKTGGTNTQIVNNTLRINFNAGVASSSGTASWFMIRTQQSYDNSLWYTEAFTFMGTVGALGSGADLELNTTTITSGQSIRIDSILIPYQTKLAW